MAKFFVILKFLYKSCSMLHRQHQKHDKKEYKKEKCQVKIDQGKLMILPEFEYELKINFITLYGLIWTI